MEQVWRTWRHRADVAQWMTNPSPDLDTYLARLATPGRLASILAVELVDDAEPEGRLVMDLHVGVQDSYAQTDVAAPARGTLANIGFSMDPEVQGRGLATEALGAALEICFDHLGLHRAEAVCFAENSASWRLMERVGMRREGHFVEQCFHRDLGCADMFAFDFLASDWRAARHA